MILSLDESGFNRQMHRLFAWSPIGMSPRCVMPAGRGRNVSLCALISAEGLVASVVHFGAMNKTRLVEFIETWPIEKCSGKHLVLDNVMFHHSLSVWNQLLDFDFPKCLLFDRFSKHWRQRESFLSSPLRTVQC